MRRFFLLIVGLLVLAGVAWAITHRDSEVATAAAAQLSVLDTLRGDDDGYERAVEPRDFVFPADHGPHPGYRTEWWYFTGNLDTPSGRPFGFQLTFFRFRIAGEVPSRDSRWSTGQVYMGHFAVTDAEGGRLRAFEKMSRGAVGLAGARAEPFRVWLDDWEVAGQTGAFEDLRLIARGLDERGEVGLRLDLDPRKPLVLQGEDGLSKKGATPGNASYYYSSTRIAASGFVDLDGESLPVIGTAWMDREWSTSVLSEAVVGWDWFALQFDDGRDLMAYQLRRSDGERDPYDTATWIDAAGRRFDLAGDLELEVLETWTSPETGISYPVRWRMSCPEEDLSLTLTALIPAQELRLSFRYWEGAVRVEGMWGDQAVSARGYAELTGYGGEAPPA